MFEKAFPAEVMSIMANERGCEKAIYELSFSEKDLVGIYIPHNDALVLTMNINTWDVRRVFVNPGSLSKVMYKNLYNKLKFPTNKIRPMDTLVFSFNGQLVCPVGTIQVLVKIGPVSVEMKIFIIDIDAPYNAILGRSWLGQ